MQNVTIGFLGDGQLAKMSAESAKQLGFKTHFLGQGPLECCSGLGAFTKGDIFNSEDVNRFAQGCDLLTLENEFIPLKILERVKDKLLPSYDSFSKIENKIDEKALACELGLPVGSYEVFREGREIQYQRPIMLKLSKGGYDGYGNFLIKSSEELEAFLAKNIRGDFIAEELIDFDQEVAVTLARSKNGDVLCYPVVDTLQSHNMCTRVMAPSHLAKQTQRDILKLAERFIVGIDYVGVMSLEFFVMKNGEVYFNESSPRPHNSGHYTMDACKTSQFENHIRAITGLALGDTSMIVKEAVMLNILGKAHKKASPLSPKVFSSFPQASFHMYNKSTSKVGRKMGHVNLVGDDRSELLKISHRIEEEVHL